MADHDVEPAKARPAAAPARPAARPEVRGGVAGLLALQRQAGNAAVTRMLAGAAPAPGPVIRRHPGTDELKDAHSADAHSDVEQFREHEKLEQQTSNEQMTPAFVESLKAKAIDEGSTYKVDLAALPPKLQALIRNRIGTIAEIEKLLAGATKEQEQAVHEQCRARMRSAARSWHDDGGGKIPASRSDGSRRAQFFQQWREHDAQGGKDVPTKQKKNRAKSGSSGGAAPYREITAVGWKEGSTKGRLIYDPLADVFYLSCDHYNDEKYFRVVTPTRSVGEAPEPSDYTSTFDLQYVFYEAWEELSRELQEGAETEDDETIGGLTEDAQTCLKELLAARTQYVAAYDRAKGKIQSERTQYTTKRKIWDRDKSSKKGPEPTFDEKAERFDEFDWKGATFVVGSDAGYIGYLHKGARVFPVYTDTKIGDVAKLFRECVTSGKAVADEATALMLAALLAETHRHPPATLEALFSVISGSPIRSGTRAFGTALPMSAGGTIGTGGVSIEVMLKESNIAGQVVLDTLGKELGMKPTQITDLLTKELEKGKAGAVALAKRWILERLRPEENRAKNLRDTMPKEEEPSGGIDTESPTSSELVSPTPIVVRVEGEGTKVPTGVTTDT